MRADVVHRVISLSIAVTVDVCLASGTVSAVGESFSVTWHGMAWQMIHEEERSGEERRRVKVSLFLIRHTILCCTLCLLVSTTALSSFIRRLNCLSSPPLSIAPSAGFYPLDVVAMSKTYRAARHRLIVLDWGGTLVAENDKVNSSFSHPALALCSLQILSLQRHFRF